MVFVSRAFLSELLNCPHMRGRSYCKCQAPSANMNPEPQRSICPPGQWVPGAWGAHSPCGAPISASSGGSNVWYQQQGPASSVANAYQQPGPSQSSAPNSWNIHQVQQCGDGWVQQMTPPWTSQPPALQHHTLQQSGFQASPPGTWQDNSSEQHRRRRHRSRSPRRTSDIDLAQVIQRNGVASFRQLFQSLPDELRAVALEAPPGILVDTQRIADQEERMLMCRRLNDLRRERLLPLASPAAVPFYQEDGFKCVPMSRQTERHFWDLFHRLPLATTDGAKWKSVLRHVEQCPEKPKNPPSARDIEWASPELKDAPPPTGSPSRNRPQQQPDSLQALQQLAAGSPIKSSSRAPCPDEDYATWVRTRVETDTANLTISTFDLNSKDHRASRKSTAEKVLKSLPPLQAMGDLYKAVYSVYHRKLVKLCDGLSKSSKEGKALHKLCADLNIEHDASFPDLLARLRASEIMHKPL